jgi:carboxyl-terminal processing protease
MAARETQHRMKQRLEDSPQLSAGRMKKSFRRLAILGVVLLPFTAGGFLLQARSDRAGVQLFDQVLSLVSSRYVDTLGAGDLYEKAARGLVEELNDPYSELLTPKQLRDFSRQTNGRYGGIGMLIEDQQGQITVSTVYPNTPAERGGVRVGDRILFADSLSTRGWKISQVSEHITGTPGTKVRVTFGRPGVPQPIAITFTREVIHIPAVGYSIMVEPGIGYVPLQRFNETAGEELERSIRKLMAEGAKSIVLDLRRNPGGILEQSLEISNMFLRNGQQIAAVKGRSMAQEYRAQGSPIFPDVPLVVLTDQYSASASEIVAGALQDHDRALVIGQTTFGKGLVQSVFNLDGGYALKLTTAQWFTPVGRSIHKERKVEDGQFVEDPTGTVRDGADTVETEADKKDRPVFRSTGGRIVYGGGGITPDLIIADDTLTAVEQRIARQLAAKQQDVYVTLYEYTFELSRQAPSNFQLQPTWRDEFLRRLEAKGVTVDAADWVASSRYVDRMLEQRVAQFAGGEAAAKHRDVKFDAPLRKAIEVLSRSTTQKDLFAIASAPQPGARQ